MAPKKCTHFILHERGKVRPIDAPHITDRQLQKAVSKEVLVPLYTPGLIYDNYASREGMGLHFAFHRLREMLHWHFRRYGRAGGIISIDLKKFFPNARRELLYQRHRELILDPVLQAIADTVIGHCAQHGPRPGDAAGRGAQPAGDDVHAVGHRQLDQVPAGRALRGALCR